MLRQSCQGVPTVDPAIRDVAMAIGRMATGPMADLIIAVDAVVLGNSNVSRFVAAGVSRSACCIGQLE